MPATAEKIIPEETVASLFGPEVVLPSQFTEQAGLKHSDRGEKRLMRSSYGSNRPVVDFPRLVGLYRAGKLMIDELVTRTYSIDQAEQAFDDLAAGELARGLIIHG